VQNRKPHRSWRDLAYDTRC